MLGYAAAGAPLISIHAPMRGRPFSCAPGRGGRYFNPRPHAGATYDTSKNGNVRGDFNPRPHAGATCKDFIEKFVSDPFQSTPPCGGDYELIPAVTTFQDFNPRPHAGATSDRDKRIVALTISIHAPMRGRL